MKEKPVDLVVISVHNIDDSCAEARQFFLPSACELTGWIRDN